MKFESYPLNNKKDKMNITDVHVNNYTKGDCYMNKTEALNKLMNHIENMEEYITQINRDYQFVISEKDIQDCEDVLCKNDLYNLEIKTSTDAEASDGVLQLPTIAVSDLEAAIDFVNYWDENDDLYFVHWKVRDDEGNVIDKSTYEDMDEE